MNEKEYQTSGNMPAGQNGPDTQQDAAQYANTVQDNSYVKPRRHRRSGAGKIGIFALGVAVGIAFLAVAAHFFPVRTIAEQTIGVDSDPMSASDSALNQESIEKLQLLEDCIREYYYEPETATVETLENGMYKGLMDSLGDPYTVYYTPEEYNSMTEETSGVYKGIGAYIGLDTKTGAPVFTGIMPGTPAEKAGLMVGDIICEVDGTDTLSMDTSEVANLVKGEEGTTVTIKVNRDGEYVTVTATRETINVPTVTSEMLDNQIGYLKISQFDDVTPGQFDEEYSKLKAAGMKSMILDLRDNPGGTVTAVTQIASEMLPEGLIFYMEDKNGEREEYTCPGADFNIPMVVLVNGYSASASEILAGAIQDAGIGTLVGTQTYGKGIVQNLYPLGDGSAIKITIADYYTRNGRNIHKVGIEPDQVLEFDKDLYEKDKTDNQLEKAKEILLSK
ncbi:MAG: S41 family peptidase [Lachnospiraceae bacterium]|nr:S41 family peptidase [Lachnospiraceae bacterium]